MTKLFLSTADLVEMPKVHGRFTKTLNFSQIGDLCARKLWYSFRWHSPPEIYSAKTQRIFDKGNKIEEEIVWDLSQVGGIKVFDRQTKLFGLAKHSSGKVDGLVTGLVEFRNTEVVLLEAKSAAQKYYTAIVNKGLKIGHYKYWSQCQIYMYYLNQQTDYLINFCYFVIENKNNQQRHYEIVKYEQEEANDLLRMEIEVITSESPPQRPARAGYTRTGYNCLYCNHNDVCYGIAKPERNCRSCDNVQIKDKGKWHCKKHDKDLSTSEQLEGCKDYSKMIW